MKRARDSLVVPSQLPPQHETVVASLLDCWRSALSRKVAQVSLLQSEQELIKEARVILGSELCGEEQKTLRWIITGGEGEAAAFQQDLIVTRISSHTQRLREILFKHHHAFLEF